MSCGELHDTIVQSCSSRVTSTLLIMCIEAPESTINSLSSASKNDREVAQDPNVGLKKHPCSLSKFHEFCKVLCHVSTLPFLRFRRKGQSNLTWKFCFPRNASQTFQCLSPERLVPCLVLCHCACFFSWLFFCSLCMTEHLSPNLHPLFLSFGTHRKMPIITKRNRAFFLYQLVAN